MDLEQMAARFPRVRLGQFPTPLEPLPRLSARLGGPRLWVKRDDCVGPGMGGNKTRKLEFLLGEAQARRAQAVATFGGLQSNFARQMACAARALGLGAHCFYFAPRPPRLEGNLLLAQLVGARLHFVPLGRGGDGGMTLEQTTRLVRLIVRVTPGCAGRRVYFMPVGGHAPLGAIGYALAAQEVVAQLAERGVRQATIVTAAGTGGTLAGLLAGLRLLGSRHQVLGIDVGKLWKGFPATIAALAGEVCAALGEPLRFTAADVPIVERAYVGEGYACLTPGCQAALREVACLEGLLLDPVYTGKAMAGLLDLARQGHWQPDDEVVFLHTGGLPAMWAYGAELAS